MGINEILEIVGISLGTSSLVSAIVSSQISKGLVKVALRSDFVTQKVPIMANRLSEVPVILRNKRTLIQVFDLLDGTIRELNARRVFGISIPEIVPFVLKEAVSGQLDPGDMSAIADYVTEQFDASNLTKKALSPSAEATAAQITDSLEDRYGIKK